MLRARDRFARCVQRWGRLAESGNAARTDAESRRNGFTRTDNVGIPVTGKIGVTVACANAVADGFRDRRTKRRLLDSSEPLSAAHDSRRSAGRRRLSRVCRPGDP